MNLQVLETVKTEYIKLRDKYQQKAIKEREKVNDVYVMVCGEKCYTESEINEWYACDYITCEQADKIIKKLNRKKATAGEKKNSMTESEMICNIIDNNISNLNQEIHDIKVKQKREAEKEERWKIAQAQGCSYKEFLELEEISRKSEEYERLMGINNSEA